MTPPRLALASCAVFEGEIAAATAGAGHVAAVRFLEIGLHDRPDVLRTTLQQALDELDARDDIDALALAYGLCGCGTAGLHARRHPLVIPRGHDCITVFLGSKERYAAHCAACPSCFFYTPGWNRARRVPGPERLAAARADLAARFDPDDVEFLLDTERQLWTRHDTATYIDLGTADAEPEADYARRCAEWLGRRFERLAGDPALLRDLLAGRWDADRFQVVAPGEQLAHSPDERIFKTSAPRSPSP